MLERAIVHYVDQVPDGLAEETNVDNGTMLETAAEQYVDQIPDGLAQRNDEAMIELISINDPEQSDGSAIQFVTKLQFEKCMDKMRNKIDYFQKRVLNEISDFKRETMLSIRKLTDVVTRSLNTELNQEEEEDVELTEKYKGIFPVNHKDTLHAVNKRIKSESEFKMFFELKMEKITGKDAIKMINAIWTINCIGKFTWLGTKNKDRFCDLESLIYLMVKILESRFPECGAYNIIELVVKQRAKSAGEAIKENGKISNNSSENVSANSGLEPTAAKDSLSPDDFIFVADSDLSPNLNPFDPEELINFDD